MSSRGGQAGTRRRLRSYRGRTEIETIGQELFEIDTRGRSGVLAHVDAHRTRPVNDLQAEVSRLKRELAIACEDRDLLKRPPRTRWCVQWQLCETVQVRYAFIQAQLSAFDETRGFSLNTWCRGLDVSRSDSANGKVVAPDRKSFV